MDEGVAADPVRVRDEVLSLSLRPIPREGSDAELRITFRTDGSGENEKAHDEEATESEPEDLGSMIMRPSPRHPEPEGNGGCPVTQRLPRSVGPRGEARLA